MARLIFGLAWVLVLLCGCSLNRNAEIEIRAEALRYAFKAEIANWESEGKKWTEIGQWLFVVECDKHGSEVIKSLGAFPVVGELANVSGERNFVERASGKSVAYWRVKQVSRSKEGGYDVDVSCVMGGLHGYGQIVRLKKVSGRWVVIFSTPTWVS